MKQLLLLVTSVALFACGGSESTDSSNKNTDDAAEAPKTVGGAIASDYQNAMKKAEDVSITLEAHKQAIDDALDEADQDP